MATENTGSVQRVHVDSLPALREHLTKQGTRVYDIDGSTVHEREDFFAEAARVLPLGDALPPEKVTSKEESWRVPNTWDSFNDFLWQGLTGGMESNTSTNDANTNDANNVALLWHHADKASAKLLGDADTCLREAADSLHDDPPQGASPVNLTVYLVGVGESFPPHTSN